MKNTEKKKPQKATDNRTDWIITVPKSVSWEDYKKYLKTCAEKTGVREYIPIAPNSKVKPGDRCYIVNAETLRGYQIIEKKTHLKSHKNPITNKMHPEGTYIRLSAKFHRMNPITMKGFRGIRRYKKA